MFILSKKFQCWSKLGKRIIDNFLEDFIADLSYTNSVEATRQVLFQDLTKNIYAEISDFDLCFTCKVCGEQIILNNFLLS